MRIQPSVATANATPTSCSSFPAQQLTNQNPAEELTNQNPSEELTNQNPSEELTNQNPSEELTNQNPSEELTNQNPSEELTNQNTTLVLISGLFIIHTELSQLNKCQDLENTHLSFVGVFFLFCLYQMWVAGRGGEGGGPWEPLFIIIPRTTGNS